MVVDIIIKLHPNDNAKRLFPEQDAKLSSYIINMLKNIDLFKDEPGLGVKYLRHSLVSTKLMQIKSNDPNYTKKVVELAEKAMHSVKMQETYTSPLKDAKGKLLNNENNEMYDVFDELTQEFENVEPEPFDDRLIGMIIKKRFGKKYYTGRVTDYDSPYYKVVYEDGDVEEMDKDEVMKYRKK